MTTSNRKLTALRRSLAFAGAFAALAATTTSFAGSQADMAPTVVVSYGDLNLSTDDGVKALYRRISSAARQVCPDVYSRDLTTVAAGERCQVAAVEQAVRQVNNSKLALVHASHVARG